MPSDNYEDWSESKNNQRNQRKLKETTANLEHYKKMERAKAKWEKELMIFAELGETSAKSRCVCVCH